VLFPLTLGLIFPYIKWKQKKYLVEHHRFGRRDFDFSASANDFYIPYFIAIGMMIGFYIGLATVFSAMSFRRRRARLRHGRLLRNDGRVVRLLLRDLRLHRLARTEPDLQPRRDGRLCLALDRARARPMRLYLFNTLGILLSAGMLIPWAMIRMARYRASRLVLLASDDPNTLEAERQGDVSAVGAEIDHVFDMDIGL
jgi:uncharacterized membrane protein YjgN (DUF898 family)